MARGQGFVTKCVAGRAWPEPKSVGILGGNWRRRSPFIPGPLGARELQLLLQGGYLLFCRLEDALQGGGAMGAGSRALLGELFPPWDEKEAQADPPGAGASRPAPPAPPRPAPPAPMCLGGPGSMPPGGTARGAWWDGPGGAVAGASAPRTHRTTRSPRGRAPHCRQWGWKAGAPGPTHPRGRRWKGSTRGSSPCPCLDCWGRSSQPPGVVPPLPPACCLDCWGRSSQPPGVPPLPPAAAWTAAGGVPPSKREREGPRGPPGPLRLLARGGRLTARR